MNLTFPFERSRGSFHFSFPAYRTSKKTETKQRTKHPIPPGSARLHTSKPHPTPRKRKITHPPTPKKKHPPHPQQQQTSPIKRKLETNHPPHLQKTKTKITHPKQNISPTPPAKKNTTIIHPTPNNTAKNKQNQPCARSPPKGVVHRGGVGMELLAQSHRHRVLQLGPAHLHLKICTWFLFFWGFGSGFCFLDPPPPGPRKNGEKSS